MRAGETAARSVGEVLLEAGTARRFLLGHVLSVVTPCGAESPIASPRSMHCDGALVVERAASQKEQPASAAALRQPLQPPWVRDAQSSRGVRGVIGHTFADKVPKNQDVESKLARDVLGRASSNGMGGQDPRTGPLELVAAAIDDENVPPEERDVILATPQAWREEHQPQEGRDSQEKHEGTSPMAKAQ
jgi:hypothetical protein